MGKISEKIRENKVTQDKFLTSIQKFMQYTIETVPKNFENNQKIEEHINNLVLLQSFKSTIK